MENNFYPALNHLTSLAKSIEKLHKLITVHIEIDYFRLNSNEANPLVKVYVSTPDISYNFQSKNISLVVNDLLDCYNYLTTLEFLDKRNTQ